VEVEVLRKCPGHVILRHINNAQIYSGLFSSYNVKVDISEVLLIIDWAIIPRIPGKLYFISLIVSNNKSH